MGKRIKGKCKLCQENSKIENSHIIPKFIGRWLKNTSGTGYLRAVKADGNSERSQDLSKVPLLCKDCEERISEFETFFANTIFYPLKNNKLQSIPTDERIGKFAVSVSLRVIWVLLEIEDLVALKWKEKILELEKEWRNYIWGNTPFVKGSNTHHILFHSKNLLKVGLPNHPNLILHLLRSSVFQIFEIFGKVYVSSHMAGIHVISMISPANLPVSRGTQVYPEQEFGNILPCGIGWGGYFQNILEIARICNISTSKITPGYIKMVDDSLAKDPEKFYNSEDFKLLIEQDLILGKKSTK